MSDKATKKKKKAPEPEIQEDEGLAALSALVRPSISPPAAEAEAEDADDGKLDLRALAASIPPPAGEESAAPEATEPASSEADSSEPDPREAAEAPKAKASEKPKAASAKPKKAPAERAPVAATEMPAPARSGGGLWIGIGIGAAIAAGAVFYVMNNAPASDDEGALASAAPVEHDVADPPSTQEADIAAEDPVAAPAEDPAAQEEIAAAPAEADPSTEAIEPVAAAPTPEPAAEPSAEPSAEPEREARAAAAEPAPHRSRSGGRQTEHAQEPEQHSTETAQAEPPPEPEPEEQHAEETHAQPSGARSIDNMLDQALGGRPNREGTAIAQPTPAHQAAPAADLPESPSRGDVVRTLGRLLPQIRQCAGDQVGMALATMMVRNDGSVASVVVGGSPFGGTPQGACMEGALRSAHFPPFRQSTFRVSYPFNIR